MRDPRQLAEPDSIPFEELNSDEQSEVLLKYHTRKVPACDWLDHICFDPDSEECKLETLHGLIKDAMMWECTDNYVAIGRHIMSRYLEGIREGASQAYNERDPLVEFEDYGEV